eukprot:scaffold20.g7828.t1
MWWGLRCQPPALRLGLTLAYCLAGAVCTHAALRASTALQRALPMLALLLLRVASFALRARLSAGPSPALAHYLAMEAYSLAGGLVNAVRLPERWFQPRGEGEPAPLDLWLNSHQIMHVLVAMALLHLHLGASADYREVAGGRPCAAVY